jgi:hypothetical protein
MRIASRTATAAAAATPRAAKDMPDASPPSSSPSPTDLPWTFAEQLLEGGALHHLPPPESAADIPFGARNKVSKAFHFA